MVALPALKLLTLGVRQITRPVVRKVVYKATASHGLTYKTCIVLGRVSLGLSGVIAEWSRKEMERLASEREHATDIIKNKANEQFADVSSSSSSSNNSSRSETSEDKSNLSSSSSSPSTTSSLLLENQQITNEPWKGVKLLDLAKHKQVAASTTTTTETTATTTDSTTPDMETKRLMEEAIAVATRTNNLPLTDKTNNEDINTNKVKTNTALSSSSSSELSSQLISKITETNPQASHNLDAKFVEAQQVNLQRSINRQVDPASTALPRSRSLLQNITYGPLPKWASEDEAHIFLNPSRTSSEAARLFIRHPYRSTWYVFTATFLAPFPEKQLVDAGAELLMELLVFIILASILAWEFRQQSLNAAKKDAYMEERMKSMENKINELVRLNQGQHAHFAVNELESVPEYTSTSRLQALAWPLIKTANLISDVYHSLQREPSSVESETLRKDGSDNEKISYEPQNEKHNVMHKINDNSSSSSSSSNKDNKADIITETSEKNKVSTFTQTESNIDR